MRTSTFKFSQTLLAVALAAAFGAAHAQDVSLPQSWVAVGAGWVSGDSKDRARFGMFNGMREDDFYGLLDFEYINRNPDTARWTTITGRDLGLDTREAFFSTRKLGDWKVFGGYSEIERFDPRTINTGMLGAGTTTPTVVLIPAPGAGQELNLKLERKAVTLGGDVWITPNLQFEAAFKNEDKTGSRQFGRGFACSAAWVAAGSCTSSTSQWALLFLPEPIDSTIRQFDAKLNFSTDRLLITAGYYGSFYDNSHGNLTPAVPGVLNNPLGVPQTLDAGLRTTLSLPIALWPDNQAHQFYVSGNYRLMPGTTATFKYAYTHATQDEDFLSMGLTGAPPGRSNLGGEINTTLAQFGITCRPMRNLTLLGNIRYEDKENKTPIALYNVEGTNFFTNDSPSPKKLTAKLEASYQFPMGYRATLGGDYEKIDHGDFLETASVAGLSGIRQKTEETGWRVELRRNLSETLSGWVSYGESRRSGDSPWLKPLGLPLTGVIEANPDAGCVPPAAPALNPCIYNRTGIFPFIFEDRKRDKVRALLDWSPMEKLSLQLSGDYGKDNYTAPTEKGLSHTRLALYGVDVSYQLNDTTRLSAYYTYSDQSLKVSHSTGYIADLKDKNDTMGLGIQGIVNPRIKWGGDLLWIKDNNQYNTGLDSGASAQSLAYFNSGLPFIPDATFRDFRIKLYGSYAVQKNGVVSLEVIHDRTKLDEWQWGYNGIPFLYSDNTTVNLKPDQNVTFVSVFYTYRFK